MFRLGVDGQSATPKAARSPASTRRIVCAVTAPIHKPLLGLAHLMQQELLQIVMFDVIQV